MSGFKCPFCGEIMSVHFQTVARRCFNFNQDRIAEGANASHLQVSIYRCPNDECRKESIVAEGISGYIENTKVNIYPQAIYRHFPDYIPIAIRSDYEEACTIVDNSPKAAATLARRCLQGMIRDFWGIQERTLNAEITKLKDIVPASQWKAIDAIRSIGNIGAHMERDVNLIVDVDPSEARKLLLLIDHLLEKWYIDRHDAEKLYDELASISQEKSDARKQQHSGHSPQAAPHLSTSTP